MQHAHAVGLHRYSGTDGRPDPIALNEFRGEALPAPGSCQGQPSDSSAADQDSISVDHLCTSWMPYRNWGYAQIASAAAPAGHAPSDNATARIALPLARKPPILPASTKW
jgi:hypothetical protein